MLNTTQIDSDDCDTGGELLPFNETITTKNTATKQQHADTLSATKRNILHWSLFIFIHSISYSLSHICWMFRAKELEHSTNESIVAFLTVNQWVFSVMTLVHSALSDKFGFDTITFISNWLSLAGVVLQCSENFYVFAIATTLKNFPARTILQSVIAKMLPIKYSTRYYSWTTAIFSLIRMLSTLFGGTIAHFIGYAEVFQLSAAIYTFDAILFYFLLSDTQSRLTQKQLELKSFYQATEALSEEEKFPICVSGEETLQNIESSAVCCAQCEECDAFSLSMLVSLASFCASIQWVFGIYYPLYIVDEYEDGNVLVASSLLTLCIAGAFVSGLLAPILVKWSNDNNQECNVLFCVICVLVMESALLVKCEKLYLQWILAPVWMFLIELFEIICEIRVIEIQPVKRTGIIAGISGMFNKVIGSIGIFIVGSVLGTKSLWMCNFVCVCLLFVMCVVFKLLR